MRYYLKYKDNNVLVFDIQTKNLRVLDYSYLPFSLQGKSETYDMIRSFCSDRLLMMNREYCKEILIACGIDDQSDINICIISRALSFRDNYWICAEGSNEEWGTVNLYDNKFSVFISRVALTGDMNGITSKEVIGDNLYTGELTNKGTRAKCFIRHNSNIFLVKSETLSEISSEVVSYYIAFGLSLPCSQYNYIKYMGKDCSICQIFTSEYIEMIPCRDIMECYDTCVCQDVYNFFIQVDAINFIKMQVFDYLTLNSDRNRDNYGVLRRNEKMVSLYPIFDHDSCFKGKSTNGIYFPSGKTFQKTLELLKTKYSQQYGMLGEQIVYLRKYLLSGNFKEIFLRYKSVDEYNGMIERALQL